MGKVVYDKDFFDQRQSGAQATACVVLPMVLVFTDVSSMVDVGCGTGEWLAVARDLGIEDVLGIDGDYIEQPQIPHFLAADLGERLVLSRRFDVALSLEVAEHLAEERAESFVADLVELAPTVVFSAAIPGQGGRDHVNEQWPDYWHGLFRTHGYQAHDLVRPAIWDLPGIAPWYAQNTFVYTSIVDGPGLGAMPVRAVHPRIFEHRIATPTLAVLRSRGPALARDFLRWRAKRIVGALKHS